MNPQPPVLRQQRTRCAFMPRGVSTRIIRDGALPLRSRNDPSLALAVVVVAALLGGCGSSSRGPDPRGDQKGNGGVFRVILTAEPRTLDPNLGIDDAAFVVAQNLFNKLVTLDTDYHVIPDLAERWESARDGLTYTFHLAPDIRWHDGTRLTSAHVKASLEAIPPGGPAFESVVAVIDRIEAPEPTTVRIRLKRPWAPFLSSLAWYGTFILPVHLGSNVESRPGTTRVIGTGPFVYQEWVPGDHVTLRANKAYFRMGPFVDELVFRFASGSVVVTDLLLKHLADLTLARPAYSTIPTLRREAGLLVRTYPQASRYYLGFNLSRRPLDDPRVRRAINMAINRPALVDQALFGYGAPSFGFYTPTISWAYDAKARAPQYDPIGVARLLDEAGLKPGRDGRRLAIDLVTSEGSPYVEIAAVVVGQLREVGIVVQMRPLNPLLATTWPKEHDEFDMALMNGSFGPDPDMLGWRFRSNGVSQIMRYSNPEVDAALDDGAREQRLDRRAAAYSRVQQILARDLPVAPLAEAVQMVVAVDGVTGLPQVEGRGLVTFQNFSLVRIRR